MKHIGDILVCIELAMVSLPKGRVIALKEFSGKLERWKFRNDGYFLNDYVEQLDILFSDIKGLINESEKNVEKIRKNA